MRQATKDALNEYILLVDSDPQNLIFLSMIIERMAYRSRSALGVGSALEIAAETRPSMVLTELFLKGLTGIDLLERLKQKPGAEAVPVAIMTRELSPEIERQCRAAGALACLEKPVKAHTLYELIQPVVATGSRRKSIRISTRLSVIVNDLPLDCTEGECATNLSVHGMRLRTAQFYAAGSAISLRIALNGKDIDARAEVVYCRTPESGPSGLWDVGLRFVTTSPEAGEIIRQFINDEVAYGLDPGPEMINSGE